MKLTGYLQNAVEVRRASHHVRNFTYDEDRCRARVRNLPQNLYAASRISVLM